MYQLALFNIRLPSDHTIFFVIIGIPFFISLIFLIANDQVFKLDTRCLIGRTVREARKENEAENQKKVESLL